jgi:hypothetical protein
LLGPKKAAVLKHMVSLATAGASEQQRSSHLRKRRNGRWTLIRMLTRIIYEMYYEVFSLNLEYIH